MPKKKISKEISAKDELKKFLSDVRSQNRRTLEKRLFELTAAFRIGKEAYYSSFDLEECLKVVVNKIADLMSVEMISLMLRDKDKGDLIVKLAKGLDEQIIKDTKIKVGESISGWIAKTGEPLLIKDITKDGRFQGKGGKYYTNSLLSVPLKIRDRVIGVINVNNKASREIFREDDLNILRTVADLAAVAIENARLHGEAKVLDKLKSDFISNISHELRTPLVTIKESLVMILDGIAGNISQDQKKFLEVAKSNIDRLGRLIDGLLDLAAIESGKADMRRALFDITHTTETVVASLNPLARKKGIVIQSALHNKEIMIWGDADKISQALTNLIDNAIKYNKPEGTVDVALEDKKTDVVIAVSDTGAGIPDADLEKIFDRFYRAGIKGTEGVKGAGLGLFITRDIINSHCGQITVKSQVGAGSRFTVTLPKNLRRSAKK